MQYFRISEKIADYLMGTLTFRLHGFTVAFDVRVRDVLLNGKALESDGTAPLLVCDGEQVLCGIALGYDSAPCFNRDMQGLPYAQLFITSHPLPMGLENESPLEPIPAEALENLLASLNRILIPQALRGGRQNTYRIPSRCPEEVLAAGTENLCEHLRKKYLSGETGFPTAYGRAHGLFALWGAEPDGTRFFQLRVPQDASEPIQKLLASNRKSNAKRSLAERKQQLAQQSEGTSGELTAAIKQLMDMPLDRLLQDKPEGLKTLSKVLPICRALLPEESIPESVPTYRQTLRLLNRLRREFGEDPALDDWQSLRMRRVSESLMTVLSDIFMPGRSQQKPTANEHSLARQPLREHLAQTHSDAVQTLANTSLCTYYQAVSRMADSGYPNWIYQTRIRPLFENRDKPESAYNLRFLAAYCQLSFEEDSVDDWKETFPLLYCLLLPECFLEG